MKKQALAKSLADTLKKMKRRIVFAESCSGGELASLLSSFPGVSEHLCGSLVVYREDSKRRWLGVKASTLKKYTAVSVPCAEEMHAGALKRTPEADLAVSVTGYLGPGNGADDGLVYVTIGSRRKRRTLELRILQDAKASPSLRSRRKDALLQRVLKETQSFLRALERT